MKYLAKPVAILALISLSFMSPCAVADTEGDKETAIETLYWANIKTIGGIGVALFVVAGVIDVMKTVILPNWRGQHCVFCKSKTAFKLASIAYQFSCEAGHHMIAHPGCILDAWADENTGTLTCPHQGCSTLVDNYPE